MDSWLLLGYLNVTHHPELWIPAGDWAEWAGSLLAGGSLIGLVVGLRRERSARRADELKRSNDEGKRIKEERRAQARQVAVWAEVAGGGSGPPRTVNLAVHVVNTSDEPVYTSYALSAVDAGGPNLVDQWSVGTVPPHAALKHNATFQVSPATDILHLDNRQLVAELLFTDANGVDWARTHFGLLVERSDAEWASRIDLSTVERSRQLRELWESRGH